MRGHYLIMFDTTQPLFKKSFFCVKCEEPCFETVFSDEVQGLLKDQGEIWLLCDECLETTTPSLDLLSPRELLAIH